MQKKLFVSLILTSLALTACSGYVGNIAAYRNGDFVITESTDNLYRGASFETIDNLMTSQGEFIFYLSRETCSSCQKFEPIMIDYIKESKQLVYKMDIEYQLEDFEKLYNKYSDHFNGLSGTPAVYIAGEGAGAYQISYSRMDNLNMFRTAMKEKVFETNVYSISKYASLESYMNSLSDLTVLIYDRTIESYASFFNSNLKEIVDKSSKELLLVESHLFSEEDKAKLNTFVGELTPLMAFKINNKQISKIEKNIDKIADFLGEN